jgi:hypothetical protein
MSGDTVGTFNGVERPYHEVRVELLAFLGFWSAVCAYVGPGLWHGRSNARHAAFAIYVFVPLVMLIIDGLLNKLPVVLLCWAAVGWYLYLKPNVRAFFERSNSIV